MQFLSYRIPNIAASTSVLKLNSENSKSDITCFRIGFITPIMSLKVSYLHYTPHGEEEFCVSLPASSAL